MYDDALDAGIIAGMHAVRTALGHGAGQVLTLWHDPTRRDKRIMDLVQQAKNLHIPLHKAERTALDKLTGGANHQGIAAQTVAPTAGSEATLAELLDKLSTPPLLLVLDGVQDPHNLGACLRTAEAAGVHAVIAPRDHSVGLTPSVCKVASGAAGQIPYIQVTNLARTLKNLQQRGLWLTGAAADATTSVYQADLRGPLVLLLGGEDKGLRRLTQEHCDLLVSLPMCGVVESLNVSVATGILLYEAVRQRSITALVP